LFWPDPLARLDVLAESISFVLASLHDMLASAPRSGRISSSLLQLILALARDLAYRGEASELDADEIEASISSASFSCYFGSLPALYGSTMARKAEPWEAGA
jgi:hypothetical protein